MTLAELNEQRATLISAAKASLAEMLQTSSAENVEKYRSITETIRDIDAQIEAQQTPGKVPAPKAADMTEATLFCKRFIDAVSSSGNFAGGMPREMAKEVIKKLQQLAGVKNYCSSFSTISEMSITVESGIPTVDYIAEGGQYGDATPQTAIVNIKAYKLGGITKVNKELLKDIEWDVVAWVSDIFARALNDKLEAEILFGTGPTHDHIEGVTTKNGIKSKVCASATTVTWAEVKACLSALGAYKKGAIIVVSQEIADVIDDFKDGSGNYIFPQNEELTRIKGHEVLVSSAMPTAAAGKVLMIAGNFNYYQIGYRETVEVETLRELFAATGQVGVQVSTRLDGRVLDASAFSVLIGKNG